MPESTTDRDGSTWIEAARLVDFPTGSARELTHAGRVYALFRVGDDLICLDGLCPHQGGRLALGPVAESVVTCPRRGCLRWRFDLRDGSSPVGHLPRLRLYPTRSEGGLIFVEVPSS